eukprot:TRINITY_DN1796_c0_g1_i1.p1 TRINITY_DN1796_c0_g1~~TRINITY_DN1796_c0_g1_i1.p1  ORF type:complete len:434 (-),score=26.86 TRINITY_DN1796_c0_g1_i1:9-1310(-)
MREILVVLFAGFACAELGYIIADAGISCAATCGMRGYSCSDSIVTSNSADIFLQLGINCKPDNRSWWAEDQPCYVNDPSDVNYGKCLGYIDVPSHVSCQTAFHATRRLCHCGEDDTLSPFFGTGLSGGAITPTETVIFSHKVAAGHYGVMTHFWTTAPGEVESSSTTIRYYVDGEKTAAIEFNPALACGVGFSDDAAPWGTKWFGLGAGNKNGQAWFHNFRVPFYNNITITAQRTAGLSGGFYIIVRGALDVDLRIGDVVLDPKYQPRLILQKFQQTVQPLDYVTITSVPSGLSGLQFMHTISVASGNLNFLEGCYHAYTPFSLPYPGVLLSTGTEDYFDSGWYFNAGKFHSPVSGMTHLGQNGTKGISWSAYRFHDMDPLRFNDGFRLVWRNGDAVDPKSGLKCFIESGGNVVGSPTASDVVAYSWVYVWKS